MEIHKIREELIEKVEGRYSQMVNQMKQVEAHQKTQLSNFQSLVLTVIKKVDKIVVDFPQLQEDVQTQNEQ